MRVLLQCFLVVGILSMSFSTFAQEVSSDRYRYQNRSRIIGGERTSKQHWPWFASLRFNDDASNASGHFCGGAVIAPNWVLTAAHCVVALVHNNNLKGDYLDDTNFMRQGLLQVVLDIDDLQNVEKSRVYAVDPANLVVHEAFMERFSTAIKQGKNTVDATDDAASAGDDIALVKLVRPWTGPLMRLSAKSETDPVSPPGTDVRVAGYGLIDPVSQNRKMFRYIRAASNELYFAGTSVLMDVPLPTVSLDDCQNKYKTKYPNAVIGAGQICAGTDAGQRDACQGDSGGPLIGYDKNDRKYQVGIVSWGHGCAELGWFGVYTKVSAHAAWLRKHVGELQEVKEADLTASALADKKRFVDASLDQLLSELSFARGRVRLAVTNEAAVKLNQEYNFEVESSVNGRLIIIDIDAHYAVTQILPNERTGTSDWIRVEPNKKFIVPPTDGSWGIKGFLAAEPLGKGRLLAIVVPENFPIAATVGTPQQLKRARGFQPVPTAPYLMNLLGQTIIGVRGARSGSAGNDLTSWGWALLEYEIVR